MTHDTVRPLRGPRRPDTDHDARVPAAGPRLSHGAHAANDLSNAAL